MSEEVNLNSNESITPEVDGAPASKAEKSILFVVTGCVILLDYLTKVLIEGWLPLHESWSPSADLATYFQITHVSNSGAAFGIFPSGSVVFMVVAVVVSVAIILYNNSMPANSHLYRVALGLQLGGALGNLVGRLRLDGRVTDFLDFGPVPVFNIADMSIVVGVIMLALLMFRDQRREQKARSVAVESEEARATPVEDGEDRSMLWNE
jgi:signal peptidase II